MALLGVSLLSDGSQMVNPPNFTAMKKYFATRLANLSGEPVFNHSLFPCGASTNRQGKDTFTVCASPVVPFPALGPAITLHGVLAGPLPLADATHYFQIGFVLDQDGTPANNYVPLPQYPSDFFKDSDLWYEADYEPGAGGGWSLKVTDARNGTLKVLPSSAARIILQDDLISLVVPASEIQVPYPSYRITTFEHTGDYGLPSPHNWNGSIQPPVAQGLQTWAPPSGANSAPSCQPQGTLTVGGVSCAPHGHACAKDADCCFGQVCDPAGLCRRQGESCANDVCCSASGMICDVDTPCCTGACPLAASSGPQPITVCP